MVKTYLLFLILPSNVAGVVAGVGTAVASAATSKVVESGKAKLENAHLSPAVKSDLRFVGFALCAVSLLGVVSYLTVM